MKCSPLLFAHKRSLWFLQNAEKRRKKVTAIEIKASACDHWGVAVDPAAPVLCRQDYTIADSLMSAPRSSYPDIVKLTERNVQSGHMTNLKVVPGYYTVETDRGDEEISV